MPASATTRKITALPVPSAFCALVFDKTAASSLLRADPAGIGSPLRRSFSPAAWPRAGPRRHAARPAAAARSSKDPAASRRLPASLFPRPAALSCSSAPARWRQDLHQTNTRAAVTQRRQAVVALSHRDARLGNLTRHSASELRERRPCQNEQRRGHGCSPTSATPHSGRSDASWWTPHGPVSFPP